MGSGYVDSEYVERIALEQGKFDELIGDTFPINVLGSEPYDEFITSDKQKAQLVRDLVYRDMCKDFGDDYMRDMGSVDIIEQKNGCFKISFFK